MDYVELYIDEILERVNPDLPPHEVQWAINGVVFIANLYQEQEDDPAVPYSNYIQQAIDGMIRNGGGSFYT